mgnify:CR=1 FL=1
MICLISVAVSGGVQRGQDQTIKHGYRHGVLVVKFTEAAYTSSTFKISADKNGLPSTGISSVDALDKQFSVRRVSNEEIYQPMNKALAHELGFHRIFLLYVSEVTDAKLMAEQYSKDASIEFATPDWEAYLANVPNDPLYSSQWGHNNTAQMPSYNWSTNLHNGPNVGTVGFDANAQSAWDGSQGYGSNTVKIGIIDTGVDWAHPDLNIATKSTDPIDGVDNDGNGKIDDYRGWDFGDNDNNPDDNSSSAGHGTCCSGIAAAIANNNLGVAGEIGRAHV